MHRLSTQCLLITVALFCQCLTIQQSPIYYGEVSQFPVIRYKKNIKNINSEAQVSIKSGIQVQSEAYQSFNSSSPTRTLLISDLSNYAETPIIFEPTRPEKSDFSDVLNIRLLSESHHEKTPKKQTENSSEDKKHHQAEKMFKSDSSSSELSELKAAGRPSINGLQVKLSAITKTIQPNSLELCVILLTQNKDTILTIEDISYRGVYVQFLIEVGRPVTKGFIKIINKCKIDLAKQQITVHDESLKKQVVLLITGESINRKKLSNINPAQTSTLQLIRYDLLSSSVIEQLKLSAYIISIILLVFVIGLQLIGLSYLIEELITSLHFCLLFTYIFSLYMPATFSEVISGLWRLETFNMFSQSNIKIIEQSLLGNVVQYCGFKYCRFRQDCNYTRGYFPIAFVNLLMIFWYLLIRVILKCMPSQSTNPTVYRIRRLIEGITSRKLNTFDQLWRIQFFPVMWITYLQHISFVYPPNSDRSQLANKLFCMFMTAVYMLYPVFMLLSEEKFYYTQRVESYIYHFEGVLAERISQHHPNTHQRSIYPYAIKPIKVLSVVFMFGMFPEAPKIVGSSIIAMLIGETMYLYYVQIFQTKIVFWLKVLQNIFFICICCSLFVLQQDIQFYPSQKYLKVGLIMSLAVLAILIIGLVNTAVMIFLKVKREPYAVVRSSLRNRHLPESEPQLSDRALSPKIENQAYSNLGDAIQQNDSDSEGQKNIENERTTISNKTEVFDQVAIQNPFPSYQMLSQNGQTNAPIDEKYVNTFKRSVKEFPKPARDLAKDLQSRRIIEKYLGQSQSGKGVNEKAASKEVQAPKTQQIVDVKSQTNKIGDSYQKQSSTPGRGGSASKIKEEGFSTLKKDEVTVSTLNNVSKLSSQGFKPIPSQMGKINSKVYNNYNNSYISGQRNDSIAYEPSDMHNQRGPGSTVSQLIKNHNPPSLNEADNFIMRGTVVEEQAYPKDVDHKNELSLSGIFSSSAMNEVAADLKKKKA